LTVEARARAARERARIDLINIIVFAVRRSTSEDKTVGRIWGI
jgi:hypothetical protein